MQEIFEETLDVIRLCMETPCCVPPRGKNMAAGRKQKNISLSFAIKILLSCSEG